MSINLCLTDIRTLLEVNEFFNEFKYLLDDFPDSVLREVYPGFVMSMQVRESYCVLVDSYEGYRVGSVRLSTVRKHLRQLTDGLRSFSNLA